MPSIRLHQCQPLGRCSESPRFTLHQDALNCQGGCVNQLKYYTSEALEELRRTIAERLDWYYAPEGVLPSFIPPTGVRTSQLAAPDLAGHLRMDTRQPPSTDVDNALAVYGSMSNLTVHQASIERMWVHLCHCDCPQYVTARWLNRRPEKDEDAVREVRNHFFSVGNRAHSRQRHLTALVAG